MKKVITYGTYDLLHQGHINLLSRAKELGDYLIVGDGVLISYKGSGNVIVLPENVKYIASGVFRDHTELESVTFPEGLISIGSYAFSGCTNLTELAGLQDSVYRDATAFEDF